MPKTIDIKSTRGKTSANVKFSEEALAYVRDPKNLATMQKGKFVVLSEGEDFTIDRNLKQPAAKAFAELSEMLENEKLIPEGYRVSRNTSAVAKTDLAVRFVKD